MTDNIIALDFNGVKVILDPNTEIIRLVAVLSSSTETMIDARDNTAYQVPTGKKATIIFVTAADMTGSSAEKIFFADNLDGTTNAVDLIVADALITNLIFITAEVPAEKFINATNNGSATYNITIIEEDA